MARAPVLRKAPEGVSFRMRQACHMDAKVQLFASHSFAIIM